MDFNKKFEEKKVQKMFHFFSGQNTLKYLSYLLFFAYISKDSKDNKKFSIHFGIPMGDVENLLLFCKTLFSYQTFSDHFIHDKAIFFTFFNFQSS